jgi:hypothetical protein
LKVFEAMAKIPKLRATPDKRPTSIQIIKGDGTVANVNGHRIPFDQRPDGKGSFEDLVKRRLGVDSLDELAEEPASETPADDSVQPAG